MPEQFAPPGAPTETRNHCVDAPLNFLLYAIGFVVLVTGLAWIATVAGISQVYVLGGVALLLCAGLFTGIANAATRDPA